MVRATLVRATMTMPTLVMAITLLATTSAASAMDFIENDFASEDSMWVLYERWCAHYNVARGPAEKGRRDEAGPLGAAAGGVWHHRLR